MRWLKEENVAEICPFRGVRYNEQLVKDLAAVICPPYDIITPQMEQELYHRNEHNLVRIEASREQPLHKDNVTKKEQPKEENPKTEKPKSEKFKEEESGEEHPTSEQHDHEADHPK